MEMLESLHIDMCKMPYHASNHCEFDKQILNYLDIHDCLTMWHAYEEYWCRQWSVNNHATNPKPTTAQKPWSRTKIEAESYEANPPNDQTKTRMKKLLIKT